MIKAIIQFLKYLLGIKSDMARGSYPIQASSINVKIITKKSDETITTNTTLQNDDELFFTPKPNKSYSISLTIFGIESTSGAIKYTFSTPTGADGSFTEASTQTVVDFGTTLNNTLDTVKFTGITISAFLTTGATIDAPFRFRWAQNTSNGTTTVKAGTTMMIFES